LSGDDNFGDAQRDRSSKYRFFESRVVNQLYTNNSLYNTYLPSQHNKFQEEEEEEESNGREEYISEYSILDNNGFLSEKHFKENPEFGLQNDLPVGNIKFIFPFLISHLLIKAEFHRNDRDEFAAKISPNRN